MCCELQGKSSLAESLYLEKDCEELEPEIRTLLCYLSLWYDSESDYTSKLLSNFFRAISNFWIFFSFKLMIYICGLLLKNHH